VWGAWVENVSDCFKYTKTRTCQRQEIANGCQIQGLNLQEYETSAEIMPRLYDPNWQPKWNRGLKSAAEYFAEQQCQCQYSSAVSGGSQWQQGTNGQWFQNTAKATCCDMNGIKTISDQHECLSRGGSQDLFGQFKATLTEQCGYVRTTIDTGSYCTDMCQKKTCTTTVGCAEEPWTQTTSTSECYDNSYNQFPCLPAEKDVWTQGYDDGGKAQCGCGVTEYTVTESHPCHGQRTISKSCPAATQTEGFDAWQQSAAFLQLAGGCCCRADTLMWDFRQKYYSIIAFNGDMCGRVDTEQEFKENLMCNGCPEEICDTCSDWYMPGEEYATKQCHSYDRCTGTRTEVAPKPCPANRPPCCEASTDCTECSQPICPSDGPSMKTCTTRNTCPQFAPIVEQVTCAPAPSCSQVQWYDWSVWSECNFKVGSCTCGGYRNRTRSTNCPADVPSPCSYATDGSMGSDPSNPLFQIDSAATNRHSHFCYNLRSEPECFGAWESFQVINSQCVTRPAISGVTYWTVTTLSRRRRRFCYPETSDMAFETETKTEESEIVRQSTVSPYDSKCAAKFGAGWVYNYETQCQWTAEDQFMSMVFVEGPKPYDICAGTCTVYCIDPCTNENQKLGSVYCAIDETEVPYETIELPTVKHKWNDLCKQEKGPAWFYDYETPCKPLPEDYSNLMSEWLGFGGWNHPQPYDVCNPQRYCEVFCKHLCGETERLTPIICDDTEPVPTHLWGEWGPASYQPTDEEWNQIDYNPQLSWDSGLCQDFNNGCGGLLERKNQCTDEVQQIKCPEPVFTLGPWSQAGRTCGDDTIVTREWVTDSRFAHCPKKSCATTDECTKLIPLQPCTKREPQYEEFCRHEADPEADCGKGVIHTKITWMTIDIATNQVLNTDPYEILSCKVSDEMKIAKYGGGYTYDKPYYGQGCVRTECDLPFQPYLSAPTPINECTPCMAGTVLCNQEYQCEGKFPFNMAPQAPPAEECGVCPGAPTPPQVSITVQESCYASSTYFGAEPDCAACIPSAQTVRVCLNSVGQRMPFSKDPVNDPRCGCSQCCQATIAIDESRIQRLDSEEIITTRCNNVEPTVQEIIEPTAECGVATRTVITRNICGTTCQARPQLPTDITQVVTQIDLGRNGTYSNCDDCRIAGFGYASINYPDGWTCGASQERPCWKIVECEAGKIVNRRYDLAPKPAPECETQSTVKNEEGICQQVNFDQCNPRTHVRKVCQVEYCGNLRVELRCEDQDCSPPMAQQCKWTEWSACSAQCYSDGQMSTQTQRYIDTCTNQECGQPETRNCGCAQAKWSQWTKIGVCDPCGAESQEIKYTRSCSGQAAYTYPTAYFGQSAGDSCTGSICQQCQPEYDPSTGQSLMETKSVYISRDAECPPAACQCNRGPAIPYNPHSCLKECGTEGVDGRYQTSSNGDKIFIRSCKDQCGKLMEEKKILCNNNYSSAPVAASPMAGDCLDHYGQVITCGTGFRTVTYYDQGQFARVEKVQCSLPAC
jgi:hypothetical protein